MNEEQKERMIVALENLKKATQEVGDIWDSANYVDTPYEGGTTPFDEILEKNYPFPNSYFDVYHDVTRWTEEAIETLKKTIV